MTEFELVVKNGTICLPSGKFALDIGVRDGQVAVLAAPGQISGKKELDASGKMILPGIVHTHVHMRDPGLTQKEDYASGTKAAAAGGITCTIDMPNVLPPTTTVERYLEKKELAASKAYVDYQHWPAPVTVESVYRFAELGITPGFKEFMVRDPKAKYPHIPELSMADHGLLFDIMKATADVGLPMIIHGADPELMHAMARPNLDDNSYPARFRSYNHNNWWFASRDIGSLVAIMIARLAGMKLHVLHLGNGRHTHNFVRQAKEEGQEVTGEMEATWLIEPQQNPQIRKWLEIGYYRPECTYTEELWEAVNDGTADVLLMEHAPHMRDEILAGEKDIWNAPAGLPALQEMVPMLLTQVNKGKTSLERFVLLAAENPARLAGLYPKKGTIQIGSDADFAIVDMSAEKTLPDNPILSKAQFTPWEGYTVKGVVTHTVVRGHVVMEDGVVVGKEGFGRFVPAQH